MIKYPVFVHFNTGRYYTPEGQQIVAMYDGEVVTFTDLDRMITGSFQHANIREFIEVVMQYYDRGWYENCSMPLALKEEIKRGTERY